MSNPVDMLSEMTKLDVITTNYAANNESVISFV